MSKKINDIDYLFITSFLRAREAKLLNRERAERMLDAKTFDEAAKVLEECGYGDMSGITASGLETKLSGHRAEIMHELSFLAPDSDLVNAFRAKYDYHNAKVLIKAEASGNNGEKLMSDAGRITPQRITESFIQNEFRMLPSILSSAITEAKDTLARTGDPQLADFVLDKAYYKEFMIMAKESGSDYLVEYGKLLIDSANLRSAVRSARMNKDAAFMKLVLCEDGNVSPNRLISAVMAKTPLSTLYNGSSLYTAASEAENAMAGGRLTEFEKICDNALMAYVSSAKLSGFGERILVAYMHALENEISAVRIIMTGRLADLAPDVIRERLRDFYV